MAVDTKNKRASALGATLVFLTFVPAPDGTITGVDKQHIAGFYSGIPVGSEAPPAAILGYDNTSETSWYGYSVIYCANHDTTNATGGDTIRAYVYCRNTAINYDGIFDIGLYSDDAGNNRPQTLLASTQISVPRNSAPGWRYADISYTLAPNTKYWMAQIRHAYVDGLDILYKTYDEAYRHSFYDGVAPLPNTWSDTSSNNSSRWVMYISYGSETGSSSVPVKYHHYRMMRG
jgi:hypothetical protein